MNGKAHVYDEYKEQVFPQHIVDKADTHNNIDEGYQQPIIFMVIEAEKQQIYENNLHISHEQLKLVYGRSLGSNEEHHEHHKTDREMFQQQLMLASGSPVEHSIYGFIELGNDIHDQQPNEINYEEKHPFDFKKPSKNIHEFYDPVAIWIESLCSVIPYITKFGMMVCRNKNELVAVSLLHFFFSFHVVCCVYEERSSNLLLELFFWKFIYT